MTFMMPTMMLIMNCHYRSDCVDWWHIGVDGNNAGWRYDGIYPVYDADHHGILNDLYDFRYAAKSSVAATRVEEVLKRDKASTIQSKKNIWRRRLRRSYISIMYRSVSDGAEEDVLHDISFTASREDNSHYRKYRKW